MPTKKKADPGRSFTDKELNERFNIQAKGAKSDVYRVRLGFCDLAKEVNAAAPPSKTVESCIASLEAAATLAEKAIGA